MCLWAGVTLHKLWLCTALLLSQHSLYIWSCHIDHESPKSFAHIPFSQSWRRWYSFRSVWSSGSAAEEGGLFKVVDCRPIWCVEAWPKYLSVNSELPSEHYSLSWSMEKSYANSIEIRKFWICDFNCTSWHARCLGNGTCILEKRISLAALGEAVPWLSKLSSCCQPGWGSIYSS